MTATIYFDNPPELTASGGDLYAPNTKYDYEPLKYDYQPIPTAAAKHADPWYAPGPSTTTKAEPGYTFYPDQTLANEAARSQIFMADMLAFLLLAFLLAGAVLWLRDIVRVLRGRIHRTRN